MKISLFILSFPLLAFAVTEIQMDAIKNDNAHLVLTACQEHSFLRGCFRADEKLCKLQVQKSYDGCVKFLGKTAAPQASLNDFERKLDSCVLRDAGLQWKEKGLKTTANCALPPQEIL